MTNAPPPLTTEERLARLEGVYEHLATKADIAGLEGQFKTEIAGLEGQFKTEIARVEGAIVELKTEMVELKTELHKGLNRNLYITIGAIVAVATLVKFLS